MATLLDDLAAFWPLDEASGNALDAHTNGIDLTETGGTIASAESGRDFEAGDTEYFAVSDNATLSVAGSSVTIRARVKLESKPANDMDIVSKFETATNNREYRLFWINATDRFRFQMSTDGTSTGSTSYAVSADNFGAPSLGVWYDIIAWIDLERQTVNISVNNGHPTAAACNANDIFDGSSPLHIGAIGRATPANYFDGIIKDVGIWKRVLSGSERTYLYNAGSGRTYAELNAEAPITAPCGHLANDMIWTWFTTPVAVHHNGKVWIGGFNRDSTQKARIAEYNIAAGSASVVSLDPDIGQTDDHNNAAIIRLASGKLLARWSLHSAVGQYSATSSNVDDASAWASTVTVDGTNANSYSQLMQATHNSAIYCAFRRGTGPTRDQYLDVSTDDGASWGTPIQFLTNSGERPYFRWWQTSGTRFDFVCTTGQPNEAVNSLYHGYMTINASTGVRSYHQSDGTLIGDDTALPLELTDLTQVYDGTTNECWIWDLRYINGQPTVAFAVFPSHGTTSHEYWIGRWDGSNWATEKISDAGTTATADYLYGAEANYSGGICLDPTDENVVYLSREYSATDFRVHQFTKSGSWSAGTWISEGSPGINARPVAVDVNGTTHVFWWAGRYTSYTDYSTVVMAHPAPQAAAATSGEQRGPVFSSVFSPVNPPLELLHALGLA